MSIRKEIVAGLVAALVNVKESTSYPIKIKAIKEFDENYLTFENHQIPCILVNDTGSETLLVRNGNDYKYGLDFFIIGFVNASSITALREQVNDVNSFIKKFIDDTSGSDIHANAQALEYLGTESMYNQSDSDAEKMMGIITVAVSMRYYISGGTF